MCLLKNGRGQVEPINARSMLDDAAAMAVATATADRPIERRRRLTPAALAVTNQKVGRAYSPIVIAGAVRLIDFVLLSAIMGWPSSTMSPASTYRRSTRPPSTAST